MFLVIALGLSYLWFISFLCTVMFHATVREEGAVVGNWTCTINCFYYYAILDRIRQCLPRIFEGHMSDVCTVDDTWLWNSVYK